MRNFHLQHPTMSPQARSSHFKQWMEAIWETIYCRVTSMSERNGLVHLAQGWLRDFAYTECAIAELRAQLEALKVIDQDQQERHRKMRAPASVRPKEEIRP